MAKPRTQPPPGNSIRRAQAREQHQRQAAAAKRHRALVQLGIIAAVAVLVIGIVAAAVVVGTRSRSTAAGGGVPTVSTTVTVDNKTVPFTVDGSAVRVGPADAKARVDLWVDYSCPHCQEFEAANSAVLNSLVAEGDVSVSYHNIQIVTDYGTQAGSAAACVAAEDPARWVGFNTALYANHNAQTDGWQAAQLRTFAQQQGVSNAALDCIAASRYTGWITANTADAAAHQIQGTPTMVLNGQPSEVLGGQDLIAKVHQLAGA
jgi:protein-disulfide isomerase